MEYPRINPSRIRQLWELQVACKSEIGEEAPEEQSQGRLQAAMEQNQIFLTAPGRLHPPWEPAGLPGISGLAVEM